MISTAKRVPAKRYLYRVRELMMDPTTRAYAFQQTSREFGVTVNALRVAAMRGGLTELVHSLKFTFPVAYEKALIAVCVLYARQGTPLTKRDFAQLATKLV